jgi:hypothetical protein
MAKAKTFLLLRERRETWRLRTKSTQYLAACPECGEEVEWLTATSAAQATELTEREVFRLAESGRIHFAESGSGQFLVCSRSLKGK